MASGVGSEMVPEMKSSLARRTPELIYHEQTFSVLGIVSCPSGLAGELVDVA